MFWFVFNDNKNTDFDTQVIQRPNIPVPKRRVEYITIAGRDGTLSETDDTYEDIQFSVPMNFLSNRDYNYMNTVREVKNWLTGSGKLYFSDDQDVFYKVKDASIDGEIERTLWRAGMFSALFVCDPYTYFNSGARKANPEECKLNPYRLSKPIYFIEGTGSAALTVNGKTVSANIESNLVIDTELSIMYRMDGTPRNSIARCNYEEFYLKPGLNDISISGGFDLKIQPNWRSL